MRPLVRAPPRSWAAHQGRAALLPASIWVGKWQVLKMAVGRFRGTAATGSSGRNKAAAGWRRPRRGPRAGPGPVPAPPTPRGLEARRCRRGLRGAGTRRRCLGPPAAPSAPGRGAARQGAPRPGPVPRRPWRGPGAEAPRRGPGPSPGRHLAEGNPPQPPAGSEAPACDGARKGGGGASSFPCFLPLLPSPSPPSPRSGRRRSGAIAWLTGLWARCEDGRRAGCARGAV